jgi:hypothetical protein
MDAFVDSEGLFRILDSRHRFPVQELIVGKIETVRVSVLRRLRNQSLAVCRIGASGRIGDVPVVPIPGHKREMVLVSAALGVEDNDGAGEEIPSLGAHDQKFAKVSIAIMRAAASISARCENA